MKRWRVWITGYEGSYSEVEAEDARAAMAKGAKEQRASHHGEIVEIKAARRAHPDFTPGHNTTLTFTEFARISRDGTITFEV